MSESLDSSHRHAGGSRCASLVAGRCCSARGRRVAATRPRFYRRRSASRASPRAQDASGAQPYGHRPDVRAVVQPVRRRPSYKPSNTRAQNVNTIDEVPDSSWFTNRIGSRQLSRRGDSRAARTPARRPARSSWTIIREKSAGRAPGFTAQRRQRRDVVPVVRSARTIPKAPPAAVVVADQDLLGARLQPGRDVHHDVRSASRSTIDPNATVRRPSGERTPFTRDDLHAILERAARNADGTYRVAAGRLLPGKVLGRLPLRRHAPRRSQRPRPARAPPRAARAARVRRLDEPDRPEGRQHARHARHRERPRRRQALPAGCRLDVRHRRQRPARVGHRLGVLLRGRPTRKRLFSFGFALSPGRRSATRIPVGRPLRRRPLRSATWKPQTPTPAYMEMRADDAFWAARRVMAFSDDLIRAAFTPAVQRCGGREASRRRAHQASRQDRRAPICRASTRSSIRVLRRHGRADVRQRRRAVRLRVAAGMPTAPRGPSSTTQPARRSRSARVRCRHRRCGRPARCRLRWSVRQGGAERRERREQPRGAADPRLFPATPVRMEARGPRSHASTVVRHSSGAHSDQESRVVPQALRGRRRT